MERIFFNQLILFWFFFFKNHVSCPGAPSFVLFYVLGLNQTHTLTNANVAVEFCRLEKKRSCEITKPPSRVTDLPNYILVVSD